MINPYRFPAHKKASISDTLSGWWGGLDQSSRDLIGATGGGLLGGTVGAVAGGKGRRLAGGAIGAVSGAGLGYGASRLMRPAKPTPDPIGAWTTRLMGENTEGNREQVDGWLRDAHFQSKHPDTYSQFLSEHPEPPDNPYHVFSSYSSDSDPHLEEWVSSLGEDTPDWKKHLHFRERMKDFANRVETYKGRNFNFSGVSGPYARNARDLNDLKVPSTKHNIASHPFLLDSDLAKWEQQTRFLKDLRSEFGNIERIRNSMNNGGNPVETPLEIARFAADVDSIFREVLLIPAERDNSAQLAYLNVLESMLNNRKINKED